MHTLHWGRLFMKFSMEAAGAGGFAFDDSEAFSDILPTLRRWTRTVVDSFTLPETAPVRSAFTSDALGAQQYNRSVKDYWKRADDVDTLKVFGIEAAGRKKAVARAKEIANASHRRAAQAAYVSRETAIGLFGKWHSPAWFVAGLVAITAAYAQHKFGHDVPVRIRNQFDVVHAAPPPAETRSERISQ